MSRVGANRPVTLRPNTQWFNPDELDESAYAPHNDVPLGRLPASGRGGGSGGGVAAAAASRGGVAAARAAAGRGGSLGSTRDGPMGGSRYDALFPVELTVTAGSGSGASILAGGGDGGTELLVPGRGSIGSSNGGSGGGLPLPLARPPSFGRSLPPGMLKISASGEVSEPEAADGGGGGGGPGGLRRVGSGLTSGAPLPGPVGPLGVLKAPPPPAKIPDRPGTITTTTTQVDAEGRKVVTKTTVTRTHSGRIRTEVHTTTSGPVHLINGHGGGGGGGAVVDEPPTPVSPGARLAQGSGLRAARSGAAIQGSLEPAATSPLSSPSPGTPPGAKRLAGLPFGGAAAAAAGGLQSPRRTSNSGSTGGPVGTPTPLARRPSQTGLLAAAPVRPVSAGRSMAAQPGQVQPPVAGPGNLRTTWGGTNSGSGSGGGAIAAGGAVSAVRMSSPARIPVAAVAKAGPGGGGAAAASPGRAPSAGRLRMSPAFAAAHGLGGNAAGGDSAGSASAAGVGSGQSDMFMFGSGGTASAGGAGGGLRPPSGRYGAAAAGSLSPPSSPEHPDWSPTAAAGRLQPLANGGGGSGGGGAAGGGRFAAVPYNPHDEGPEPTSLLQGHAAGPHAQTIVSTATVPPPPAARPGSAVRSPSSKGMTAMPPPEAAALQARLSPTAPPAKPVAMTPPTAAKPTPPPARPAPPSSPPAAASPKAAAVAAAAAALTAGGADGGPVRMPQPPISPKPPAGDGPEDGAARFRPNMGKAMAASKMMAVRRNAGQCAVSLAFLRRFRSRLIKERRDATTLCTSQVVQEVIKPMTSAAACRLTDLGELVSEADVGPPDYFISHAWSMPFLQLLDCFFDHLQGALDSTRVWLDIFAVNQHPGAEQKDDLENLRTAIALSQATLVCLDARGTPLERVWCLYEFDNTLALKGADALVLLTPGFSTREIASIFRSIDVDAAKATVLSDKQMILDDIKAKHGSTEAFNAKLKLRFLLDPLDAKPDMVALAARAGTDPAQWNLGPVAEWLAVTGGPQVAVLTAAPGTGKSTITAVLCMGPEAAAEVAASAAAGVSPERPSTAAAAGRRRTSAPGMAAQRLSNAGGGGGPAVTVQAYHFCKYSDARRQDPVRVVKTLAYQLAQSLPELGRYYCGLDPGTLMQLNQPDAACRELLVMPLQQHAKGQQILMVLDALDEADKAPQVIHNGNNGNGPNDHAAAPPPSALDNKVLQLLLHALSLLPPHVRLLATIRPDPHLLGPLRTKFPDLREFTPGMLRRQGKTHAVMQTRLVERFGEVAAKQLLAAGGGGSDGSGGGSEASLVYYPVVALLRAPLERVPAGLQEAYGAVFLQMWPADQEVAGKAKQLLEVLVAAQEPPPMSLLAALGLSQALEALPGWGVLFYERDHAVHVLHRTLIDWLEDRLAAGPHHADARRGHSLLGKHLLRARPMGVYGARYLATHLIKAGSEPALLDEALLDLVYLEAACRTGDVFKLHAELASLPPELTTDVVADVVRWLGLNGAVLWSHPQSVTQVAAEAPRCSSVWQVGDRSAKKNAVDMLNEPFSWPLEVMALTQHKAAVPDVSYSPDGRLMVSASLDGTVRLWDAATGEPKAALAAPPAHCLSYSPGGELMATGGDGGVVCLWDPLTGLQRDAPQGHKDAVTAVAFSPDGQLLASGGRDKAVRLWQVGGQGCSKRADLKGHTGPLLALAFSPDGAVLASAAAEDAVPRLWSVAAGKLLAALEGHRQGVLSLVFSPAGGLLATAADNVRLWDAASGAPRGALTDHIFPVAAVAFTPDGGTLVSADECHTLRLWGIGGGGGGRPKGRGPPGGGPAGAPPAAVVPLAVLEADSGGKLSALAVSPDGGFVATASATGELHVFAVSPGGGGGGGGGGVFTVRAAHAGQVRRLAFSPDSRSLVSASDDCTLRLWDPRVAIMAEGNGGGGGGASAGGEGGLAQAGAVTSSVHFSRGSPLAALLAASVGEDGTLALWDGSRGEPLAPPQRVTGSPRPVVVRLSPDEETLAVGEPDGSIRLWDLVKGALRARLKGHTDAITDLDFCGLTPALLISASEDCRVRLWNTATGRQLALLTGHTSSVTAVAIAVDGAVAASGDDSGAIRLWAVGDGAGAARAAAVLKGHAGAVLRLAFCPDGGLLASGGADCSVRLWDVGGGGKQLAVLGGHKEAVGRLVWGPTGRLLASGSRGEGSAGSVFVWDCRTGEPVYSLHAAYMAPEDGGRPGGPGGLCTVVSALEHAPHLTLVSEAAAGGGETDGVGAEVEAAGGLLRLRQIPLYTSFAAPSCVAVAEGSFAMAFGSHVHFYRVNEARVGAGGLG